MSISRFNWTPKVQVEHAIDVTALSRPELSCAFSPGELHTLVGGAGRQDAGASWRMRHVGPTDSSPDATSRACRRPLPHQPCATSRWQAPRFWSPG